MHQERGNAVNDADEEGEIEHNTTVGSLMDAEEYVSKLKQFAATNGQCEILSNVMELEEMFIVIRVNASFKDTTINFFLNPSDCIIRSSTYKLDQLTAQTKIIEL